MAATERDHRCRGAKAVQHAHDASFTSKALNLHSMTGIAGLSAVNLPRSAGLFPSAVQIFVVFPSTTPFGTGGVGLGKLTPIFVIIFNTIGWSLPAYLWFRLAGTVHGAPMLLIMVRPMYSLLRHQRAA